MKKSILFICMIALLSCKDKEYKNNVSSFKNIVTSTLGKELLIPDNLLIYKPFKTNYPDSLGIAKSTLKIYSHIDASCGTCINKINKWNELAKELNAAYDISIILICNSDDDFELLKYFCETEQIKEFPFPFFLDKKNKFKDQNKFMEKSNDFKTVLTDKNNNILLMGNPIRSDDVKDLYLKEIEIRQE